MSDDSDSWSLDPELFHDDYLNGPKVDQKFGSKMDNPATWFSFVVGLKMKKKDENGNLAYYNGTGFFLNLPDAKYKGKDVKIVLTAGHNLIGKDGNIATTIEVTSKELDKSWKVSQDRVKVCPDYYDTRDKDASPHDWGVIFIPTDEIDKGLKELGFEFHLPFALQLPFESGEETKIDVLGVKQTKSKPEYVYSRLHFFWSTKQHLVYKEGGTEQGMSGSPLWITCNKLPTVVGIHTTGSSSTESTARGVWLNLDILERIFSWTSTSSRGRLKTYERGLYLSFSTPGGFGRVRLGSDGLQTILERLPAGTAHKKPTYAFRLVRLPSWPEKENRLWLLWNPVRKRVLLSTSLERSSLVCLQPRPKKTSPAFGVMTLPINGQSMYLSMGSRYICEDDRCYGPVESSEVSLIPSPNKGETTRFCLEPDQDSDI